MSDTKDISYSPVLERLRAQRSAPALEPGYTIGGEIETSVHRQVDAVREKQIASISERLGGIKGHIENEFSIAKLRASAAHDFERER